MKKNITIFWCIIILMFLFPVIVAFLEEFNPNDYARITDVEYTARVADEPGSYGKAVITEKIKFDIHAASRSNLYWELWRDLCENYVDGVKVSYKVNSVKQILDDGTKVVYQESPQLYWDDSDFSTTMYGLGPGKWFHSPGQYNESRRQYECVLFYVDGMYREKPTFEVEYEMTNASLRYNDCSELYLSMYSGETLDHLKSFKGQILVPDADMPSPGNFAAHTYGTNSNEFPFTLSSTANPGYHTFSFELDESDLKFKPYNKYIEFTLVSFNDDKQIFTDYAARNDYYNYDVLSDIIYQQEQYEKTPKNFFVIKITILILSLISAYLIVRKAHKTDKKIRNKYNFYTPTMQMQYFREIPSDLDPVFASKFAFCKTKPSIDLKEEYAAIVLSLVRKQYIELEKINPDKSWTNSNVKIILKHRSVNLHPDLKFVQSSINEFIENEFEDREPLTVNENYYFKLISRHATNREISMTTFQSKVSKDYENTNTFVKNIKESISKIGLSGGYFQKADFDKPKTEVKSIAAFNTFMGLVIMIILNLISYPTHLDLAFGSFFIIGSAFIYNGFYLHKASKNYILLTQFGEDEYVKWNGLYNFLNSETLMNEKTVVELPLWEQYLIYATAFGISNKVIRALQLRCPELETSDLLGNPYYRSTNFYSSSRSFRSSVHTTSNFATYNSGGYGGYSGGFGGHGGYGGGGRGGGGGGGGH